MSADRPLVENGGGAGPFSAFAAELVRHDGRRAAIDALYRAPETEVVPALVAAADLPPAIVEQARAMARRLVTTLRERPAPGLVQALMREYDLSSQEGVALMCMAEALLRIPDAATRDALIADKIGGGEWRAHVGQSPSPFVNAATWGLLITGQLVSAVDETGLAAALNRLIARSGAAVIRASVDTAMRVMGEQFVCGQTIGAAIAHARPFEARGFRYSYDMLGEAATTAEDAERYLAAYETALKAIGAASAGRGVYEGPGLSVKLSALHPRYSRSQRRRAFDGALSAAEAPRRHGARVRRRPQHRRRGIGAARHLARPAGGAVPRSRHGRLERRRLRRPGLPEARRRGDRLDRRAGARDPAAHHAAAGQGRLLGQRDQARAGRGARRLPGVHAQDPHRRLLHRLRAATARRARRGLPAVRHPQRADAGDHPRHGRRELLRRAVRVPVPARHGRTALQPDRRRRARRAAVPRLRAGRLARDAARLSGAPPARERRQHLVRQPHRRRVGVDRRADRRPGRGGPARSRRSARRIRRSRCRAISTRRREPNSAGLDLSNEARLAALAGMARQERANRMARRRRGAARRGRSSTPPIPPTSSARSSTPGARTSSAPSPPRRRAARPGRRARRPNARRSSPPPRRASRTRPASSPA